MSQHSDSRLRLWRAEADWHGIHRAVLFLTKEVSILVLWDTQSTAVALCSDLSITFSKQYQQTEAHLEDGKQNPKGL